MKKYLHMVSGLNHWLFLGLALIFGIISLVALRANNLNAIALRDEVMRVDQANGNIEAALQNLRRYVYSHMNTDLSSGTSVYPPIQLKYSYERMVAAEKARVERETATVYSDAQRVCEQQNPADFSGRNRVPCIEQYVTSHSIAPERLIPDSLYKFDFASPAWSPDLAGFSLLFTGLFAALGGLSFLTELWLKNRLL